MQVENQVGSGAQTTVQGPQTYVVSHAGAPQIPVGGIEEFLTTALFNTERFDLAARKAVGAVMAEQDLGTEGRV